MDPTPASCGCSADLADVLSEVRAIRAAIEGPAGLHVRLALVETAVAKPAAWPDPRWVGGLVGAVILAILSGAGAGVGLHAAQPEQPSPCVATCTALGLGAGTVTDAGICACDGWPLGDATP